MNLIWHQYDIGSGELFVLVLPHFICAQLFATEYKLLPVNGGLLSSDAFRKTFCNNFWSPGSF